MDFIMWEEIYLFPGEDFLCEFSEVFVYFIGSKYSGIIILVLT